MRISVTTTSNPVRGFSLLEIMVVAALIGVLAAFAVPMVISGGGGSQLKRQADQVSALLEQLNEQSLFVGELLAARLEEDRVVPLRYSHQESGFVPTQGRSGGLSELELAEGIRLEWELEQSDRRGPDLRDALGKRLTGEEDEQGRSRLESRADESGKTPDASGADSSDSDQPLPQVFFFPSGEVTPVTLWLRGPDTRDGGIQLELNTVGRVARPGTGERANAD